MPKYFRSSNIVYQSLTNRVSPFFYRQSVVGKPAGICGAFVVCGLIFSAVASAQDGASSIEEDATEQALIQAVRAEQLKKWKKTKLVKGKWHKEKYQVIDKRRLESKLPKKLSEANIKTLVSDPALRPIANIDPKEAENANNPHVVKALRERLALMVETVKQVNPNIPYFPEVGILLTHQNMLAQVSSTGQIVLGAQMAQLSNWDQVDFILAHELAHILRMHSEDDRKFNLVKQITFNVLLRAEDENGNAALSKELIIGTLASELIISPRRGRKQEVVADKLALDIMAWQELAISEGEYLFGTLAQREKKRLEEFNKNCKFTAKKGGFGGFMKSTLGSVTNSLAVSQGEEPTSVPEIADPCLKPESKGLFDGLTRTHQSNQKRSETILKYREKYYPDYPDVQARPFADDIKDDFFSPTSPFARSATAADAMLFMRVGNYETGGQLAEESFDPADVNSNKPRLAMYMLETQRGNNEAALKHLDILIENNTAGRKIYELRLTDFNKALEPVVTAYTKQTKLESLAAVSGLTATVATEDEMPEAYDAVKHAAALKEITKILGQRLDVLGQAIGNFRSYPPFYIDAIKTAAHLGYGEKAQGFLLLCKGAFPEAINLEEQAKLAGNNADGQGAGNAPANMKSFADMFTGSKKSPTPQEYHTLAFAQCEAATTVPAIKVSTQEIPPVEKMAAVASPQIN